MLHLTVASLRAAAATDGPTVLLGDFNLLSLHAPHRGLRSAGLADAFREAGSGRGSTHPRRIGALPTLPFWRIDYIWYTRHFAATRAWTGPHGGSDHVPVLAHLRWHGD